MALTVSSTTDDQSAVNAAAGIEAPEVEERQETAQRPPKVPPEPEPDPDEYEEEDEENGEEQVEEQPPPPAKKTGGFQRKIERLTRQVQELSERERRLLAGVQQQPPVDRAPRPEDFPDDYEAYDNARIEYRVAQALESRERQFHQQRLAQEQAQQIQDWHTRVGQFKATTEDFDDVLETVDHIEIPRPLQQAIMEDELGPRLAYELARNPERFEKIARLSPVGAIKALGEFKAGLNTAKAAPPQRKPVSNAPEPIRPVANGSSGTAHKPLDQLPLSEYIRVRNKQESAAGRNH